MNKEINIFELKKMVDEAILLKYQITHDLENEDDLDDKLDQLRIYVAYYIRNNQQTKKIQNEMQSEISRNIILYK